MYRPTLKSILFYVLVCAVFISGSMAEVVKFRQGQDNGFGIYGGAVDTYLNADDPDTNFGSSPTLWVDFDAPWQSLLRFNGIFGASTGQIPSGSTITSATLTLYVENQGLSRYPTRMLQDWDAGVLTWNNAKLGSNTQPGIQADGIEAILDTNAFNSTVVGTFYSIDVTAILQEWSDGAPNYGFFLRQTNTNALGVTSSDGSIVSNRPALEVLFTIPEPTTLALLALSSLALFRRR